jgi:hypothetical protein
MIVLKKINIVLIVVNSVSDVCRLMKRANTVINVLLDVIDVINTI